MMFRSRLEALVSSIVSVHPHEMSSLLHSFSCFFFILCAYFIILPLRDEGAMSLGLTNLPGLFMGSLILTLLAAPVSTLIFSLPNLSKQKALVLIHRFFSVSLVLFFILWHSSSAVNSTDGSKVSLPLLNTEGRQKKVDVHKDSSAHSADWSNHGWFYISVRIGLFLWVALLNLITISSTWARVIDVMDNESGSRLFGFIGAGATLGQLFGSLFAAGMARLGSCAYAFCIPFSRLYGFCDALSSFLLHYIKLILINRFFSVLLLFAALLMELAAQSSKGINQDITHGSEELNPIREADNDQHADSGEQIKVAGVGSSPNSTSAMKPQLWVMLDGIQLIMASSYLLYVSLFLWLGAVVSSFFYFQKVTVIAMTVSSPIGRRRIFAQINSFTAIFILAGQLTLTGRILTIAGITTALCSAPFVAFSNMVAIAVWPTWIVVAISETLRKVVTYVLTRPGRELLFTVVSQDEKYKAKVCIDVIVQRLGDATAAGMYKLLFSSLNRRISSVPLYALPICFLWIVTAFNLGRRQVHLAKLQTISTT